MERPRYVYPKLDGSDRVMRKEERATHYVYRKQYRVWLIPSFSLLLVGHFGFMMHSCGWIWQPHNINPMYGPSTQTLISSGAQTTDLVLHKGEWQRLFTSIFVHAGVIYLGLNVMGLQNIGGGLERAFGAGRVALICIFSGLFGNLASALFLPTYICVGASGAIFGE